MSLITFPSEKNRKDSRIECLVLPVAPQGNHRIRFDPTRKTSVSITPHEAVDWISDLKKGGKSITSVEIKGPGDAFASPDFTLRTLELLKKQYPEIETGISTVGIGAAEYSNRLADAVTGHVTIEMHGVDPAVLQRIYAWVRPGKKTIPLARAAEMLAESQEAAIKTLAGSGIRVRIRTTVFQGINDSHISELASAAAEFGAEAIEILPCSIQDDVEEDLSVTCSAHTLEAARRDASQHLDVIRIVISDITPPSMNTGGGQAAMIPKPTGERPNVAVASSDGMNVDLHLGQADRMLIYGPREDGLSCFLETRPVPAAVGGKDRWSALAGKCLHDCFCIIVSNAGETPRKVLGEHGIKVLVNNDNIEGLVDVIYHGSRKKKCKT